MSTQSETGAGRYALPERLHPVPERTGLDTPYYEGVAEDRLVVQRCNDCHEWQWGPEWTCYSCGSTDIAWEEVPRTGDRYEGAVYSWERIWHPTDPRLSTAVPFVVLLVELPTAGNIRMLGNLIGDQQQTVAIDQKLGAVFEHHDDYTLVQWEILDH